MESAPDESASSKDFLNASKDIPNSKMKSSKEKREEYFNQLQAWLTMMNTYQCYYNKLQQEALLNKYQQISNNSTETRPRNAPNTVPETPTVDPNRFCGSRCRIPSLWKRFGAEMIDFFLLSIIKFVIAYFAVDSIVDIDFRRYNHIFMLDDFNMDYTTAVEMTSELFALEVTHRLVVCIYEIWCLQGPTLHRGGATIGKMLLDLQVVRASKAYHIRGQPASVIAVSPGGCMGWKRAAIRSVSKNLFFAFLFPLPFITAAANQNRCAYDILCGSVVVENVQPLRCEQSELVPIP